MSFNLATRINNLQQEVNTIANKGLSNPLQVDIDGNNQYGIKNIASIDGGTEALTFNTSNASGILSNTKITTTADLSCNTLHYTELDPPVNANPNLWQMKAGTLLLPNGDIQSTFTNSNGGFYSIQALTNPTIVATSVFAVPDGNNSYYIGYSKAPNATSQPASGVYWYPVEGKIENIETKVAISYASQENLTVSISLGAGSMKIYVNGEPQPTLTSPVPTGSYYLDCWIYVGQPPDKCVVNNITFGVIPEQNLNETLIYGNDAGGLNIENVAIMFCEQIGLNEGCTMQIQPGTKRLSYTDGQFSQLTALVYDTVFNPLPTSINTVAITNLGDLHTYTVYIDPVASTNSSFAIRDIGFGSVGIVMEYDNANTAFYTTNASASGTYGILQYKYGNLYNTPLSINNNDNIVFNSNELYRGLASTTGQKTGMILDTAINPPEYIQVVNVVNQQFNNVGFGTYLFSVVVCPKPIVPASPYYTIGTVAFDINTMVINFTSITPYTGNFFIWIDIADNPYDPNYMSSCTFPCQNTLNWTFTLPNPVRLYTMTDEGTAVANSMFFHIGFSDKTDPNKIINFSLNINGLAQATVALMSTANPQFNPNITTL